MLLAALPQPPCRSPSYFLPFCATPFPCDLQVRTDVTTLLWDCTITAKDGGFNNRLRIDSCHILDVPAEERRRLGTAATAARNLEPRVRVEYSEPSDSSAAGQRTSIWEARASEGSPAGAQESKGGERAEASGSEGKAAPAAAPATASAAAPGLPQYHWMDEGHRAVLMSETATEDFPSAFEMIELKAQHFKFRRRM